MAARFDDPIMVPGGNMLRSAGDISAVLEIMQKRPEWEAVGGGDRGLLPVATRNGPAKS